MQTRFPTSTLVLARAAFGEDVAALPAAAQAALDADLPVDPAGIDHVVYLGRGWTLGLAHEAALKIREAAQAHAESYPALDYRHGPIALAGPATLVWGVRPDARGPARRRGGDRRRRPHLRRADPLAQLVLAQRFAVAKSLSQGLRPRPPT